MSDDIKPTLQAALGDLASADHMLARLQELDLYVMHWPERRVRPRIAIASLTAAGPMKIRADDLSGMGVRLSVEAQITGHALISQLSYQDAAQLGAWLIARGMMAQQREPKHAMPAVPGAAPAVDGEPREPDRRQSAGGSERVRRPARPALSRSARVDRQARLQRRP